MSKPIPEKVLARFWSKVHKTDGCWLWRGTMGHAGYGQFYLNEYRRNASAHRVAIEVTSGPVPAGMVVDHMCKNRQCVNPAHLRITTQRVNTLENSDAGAARNAAKTQCKRGHAPNWRHSVKPDGRTFRVCRDCEALTKNRPRKYGLRRLSEARARDCEEQPYVVLQKGSYKNGRAPLLLACPYCSREVRAYDHTIRAGVGKPCLCGALLARGAAYRVRALV